MKEQHSLLFFLLCLAIVVNLCATTNAQETNKLAYTIPQGHKLSYEFEINIDSGEEVISYTGITSYTVDSTTEQQLRLTYSGGLREFSKPKQTRRSSSFPFGPRSFPSLPAIPSIFGRHNFLGRTSTTNQITMTIHGRVLTLDGSSQLPYLLGNVSLIPFEPLPEEGLKKWSAGSGVTISEQAEDRRFPYRPFGPLVGQTSDSVQAASETTNFEIKSSDANSIVIEKKYELSTPDTGDRETFQMKGVGTWTFDTSLHAPSSSAMKYTLVVKDRNTSTTFPIDVKFTYVTEERLAKLAADAKAASEKAAKLAAERKIAAEAPLSEQETAALIADLKSGDHSKMIMALSNLTSKNPKNPDPKLVEAIREQVNNSNMSHVADRALRNFDLDYKLNKEYEGPHPVPSSDLPISEATELYVGQIIQAREHGSFWWPAELGELKADGKLFIKFRGWGNNRTATLTRSNIQLAPKQVKQPQRPARSVGQTSLDLEKPLEPKTRTWTDASGSFKVEAVYIGVSDGKVVLRRTDNREVSVPLSRLCLEDRRYVAEMQEAAKKLGNPFEPTEPTSPFEPK